MSLWGRGGSCRSKRFHFAVVYNIFFSVQSNSGMKIFFVDSAIYALHFGIAAISVPILKKFCRKLILNSKARQKCSGFYQNTEIFNSWLGSTMPGFYYNLNWLSKTSLIFLIDHMIIVSQISSKDKTINCLLANYLIWLKITT